MKYNDNDSRRSFIKKLSISAPLVGGILVGNSCTSDNNDSKKDSGQWQNNGKSMYFDTLIYGATSAGVMAAYCASQYGLNVLLVEPGRHIGGMTSGGLGATDTGGDASYISGLSHEFYLRIGHYYGNDLPAYRFEPHVAESIFKQYLDEGKIEILFSRRITAAEVEGNRIKAVELEYSDEGGEKERIYVRAANFIDASYEGDLMAKSGVSYTIGRESNEIYGEKYNGVIRPGREAGTYGDTKSTSEWDVDVDPFIIPGKPSSGLLPEINGIGHAPLGSGDDKVQAYCFRLCLTQNKENQIPWEEPKDFDPYRYELLARLQKAKPWKTLRSGFNIPAMPNGKTDVNNYGLVGFSSNQVGKNFDYPDADYVNRKRIWNEHISYQKGLLWFLANDDRVPVHIRNEINTWGYCRDEFLDTKGWPHQLYIREARRMVSDFIMTEHECVGHRPVKDGIAMGGYALDSHVVQRIVVDGRVENEGNFFVAGFDPYFISYRSIVPKKEEITNLLVPICISSSHVAFGSIRMEPVFMALGQAAGVASYLAVSQNKNVQDIDVSIIQKELRENPLVNRKVPGKFKDLLPFKG
ncbi:MAG: FAD-dependent oxidoreductase [Cyclobacteriaceae bacterium]|nr:FAD-dependent oxidoreductase [Cyclobacteriaceae bacterium]